MTPMGLQFLSICCFHIHFHLTLRIHVNEKYEEMEVKFMKNTTRVLFLGEFHDAIHFIVL